MNASNRTQNPAICIIRDNDLVYLVMSCIIVAMGIVGNIIVIYAFRASSKQKPRKRYEILIWYLAFFDLITLIASTLEIYERSICHAYWPYGSFACKIVYPIYYINFNVTICILILIALDRYRCIVTPFKPKFTSSFVHGLVFISVLISCAMEWYQFYELHYDGRSCKLNKRRLRFTVPRLLSLFTRDFVFIGVFIATTLKICISFEKRKKNSLTYRKNKQAVDQKNRHILNMLVVIGLIFFLLVLPYDLWEWTMLISRILPVKYRIKITNRLVHLDTILTLLQQSNMTANCIAYAKMHRRFFYKRLRHVLRRDRNSDLLRVPLQSFRASKTYDTEHTQTRSSTNNGSFKSTNSNSSINRQK